MAQIVLFGATGFTGRLTATALAARRADIAIVARDKEKLRHLALRTGNPPTHQVSVGETERLVEALQGARVLISCVGPFTKLGDTAVEAALRARVHYIDSTGEGIFVNRLLSHFHDRAVKAGVTLAPALGFDEVPGDYAMTLACEGLESPRVCLTYALPTQASVGTIKSAVSIITTDAPWIVDGVGVDVGPGRQRRWAPMPAPLGPRQAVSFPLAEAHLAPLHLDLKGLETYVTVGRAQEIAMRVFLPALRLGLSRERGRDVIARVVDMASSVEGPSDPVREKGRWTILVEANGEGGSWRNVYLQGTDVYGLTASLLAAGAVEMAQDGYTNAGVVAPIDALGRDVAERELRQLGVKIEIVH